MGGAWAEEYREGLSETAAALNRIADEMAIANRLAAHAQRISMADAQQIFGPTVNASDG